MDEKLRFAVLAQSGRHHMADLCHDFGISRKTGHKYLKRYADRGASGLKDMSRRQQAQRPVRFQERALQHAVLFLRDRRARELGDLAGRPYDLRPDAARQRS